VLLHSSVYYLYIDNFNLACRTKFLEASVSLSMNTPLHTTYNVPSISDGNTSHINVFFPAYGNYCTDATIFPPPLLPNIMPIVTKIFVCFSARTSASIPGCTTGYMDTSIHDYKTACMDPSFLVKTVLRKTSSFIPNILFL
jgi:hypothetical protein